MAARIHPVAEARIHQIWDYTEKTWGLRQADKYVRELVIAIHSLSGKRRLWKPLADEELEGIFYFRHQHHYVFFRELQAGGNRCHQRSPREHGFAKPAERRQRKKLIPPPHQHEQPWRERLGRS